MFVSEQSVNTASEPTACPPPSSRGPVVGGNERRAGHGEPRDDHVLPVARDPALVGRAGRSCESVATPEQDTPAGRLLERRRVVSVARRPNATRPRSVQHPRGERQHVAPSCSKPTSSSRTAFRLPATTVRAATAILSALSHLVHAGSAYSIDDDPSPDHQNASSWHTVGGQQHGYVTYGNRFGRLLVNGTRTVVAAAAAGTSTVGSSILSTVASGGLPEQGPFDGDGAFVPAGGTVSAGFNDSSEMPQIPEYIRATSMVFCIIIMCLGVIGNIMVSFDYIPTLPTFPAPRPFVTDVSSLYTVPVPPQVPIVILKTKDMRNSTNIFLTNLSIADLLVLLVCTPTVLVEVNSPPEVWVLGEEMCKYSLEAFPFRPTSFHWQPLMTDKGVLDAPGGRKNAGNVLLYSSL